MNATTWKKLPVPLHLFEKSLPEIRFLDTGRSLLQWRYEYAHQTNEPAKRKKLLRPPAKRGTGRYVYRMLALKQIMEEPHLYDFYVDHLYPVEPTSQIKVTKNIKDLADFAQEHGISYKTLKRFIPGYGKPR